MLHRFAVLTAVLTFPLIFAGATVTTKDAALAVPDWPLSYGSLFPRMVGNILYEHGHRMLAGTVALATLVLAVWVQRSEPRRWVRALAWTALAAVLLQATLGGLTVLNLRPPGVSAIHACLAQAFFALVSTVALVTSPGFAASGEGAGPEAPARGIRSLRVLALVTVAVVYLQVVLGAAVRHGRAALSIPDFPLAFGKVLPSAEELALPGVAVQLAHRLGAALVLTLAAAAALRAASSGRVRLRSTALVLLVLVLLQALLGASTVWSGRAYLPATAHVAFGALVLVTSVVLSIRSCREAARLPAARPRTAVPSRAGAGGTRIRANEVPA